jgi:hypothetical protein
MTSPSHGEDLVFESRRAHIFYAGFSGKTLHRQVKSFFYPGSNTLRP